MKTIALLIVTVLAGSVSGQLTEESIRKLFSHRDEFIRQGKAEEIRRLYTSNVTIRISSMGREDEISADEYFSSFTSDANEAELQSYTTTPINIEIAAGGQSAQIENEVQCSVFMTKNDDQVITFFQDESLTVTNIGHAPTISSARIAYRYHPESNELYTRVMARLEEKGEIDTETAIAWLKEAGCTYQEGDGKRRKTTVSTKNNFTAGDEVAILAAQIPDVQVLWLNFISDEGMEYVSQMRSLESLMAMHSEVTDNGVAKLAACTNLSMLGLTSPNLTDKALETIAAFPKIGSLHFSVSPGTGKGLAYLARATKLEYLMLYNVSREDLSVLEDIPNLQTLMINGNDSISDKELFHFENMKQLKSLYLYGTKATYAGIKHLKEKRPDLYIGPDWLANPCKSSLRRIEMAKKSWAEKYDKKTGVLPTREDLDPHLKAFGGWEAMKCQDDGALSIHPIGEGASCSIHGAGRARQPAPKGLSKEDFDIDGAKVGRWTMDLDAAKNLAADKQLPILLNFTGSDWCYWCKLMEKNVFTKPEWSAYATNNIVLVLIDFPRDKTAVPEKYKVRNETLIEQYKISGYPTFVLLQPDGKTELGRLKAGRDKTPASFIEEVKALLKIKGEK